MKKYKEYQETGDFKLKEVPSHWQVTVLKRVTEFKYGDALQSETRDENGNVNVYGSNGIVGKHNLAITQAPCIIIGRKGSYGKVNYSEEPCFPIDTAYFIDETVTKNDLRFIYYLVQTCELDTNSRDSAVPGLSREEAYNKKIALPPLPEQRAIAAYLEHKTAQLDTLLTQKETLLQLLHKKREAIINEAVTQGLDPTAPRKPSGVAWLGDVPAHWEVKKLKYVADLNSGNTITAEDIDIEGAYPVYGGNGLRGYSSTFTHEGYYALVGRQGHLCGNINYAQGQFFASEHALVVSLKGEYETTWLGELLRTMNLGQYSQAAAQPGLSAERLVNLIIPVPPLVEQKEIVDFIEAKTSKINKAATAIHTQIKMLRDYRQSLISEVVTGKVDVRAAEPVAPEADLPLWRQLV